MSMKRAFGRGASYAAAVIAMQALSSAGALAAETRVSLTAVPAGAAFAMGLRSDQRAPQMVQTDTDHHSIGGQIGKTLARLERAGAMRMGVFSTIDHSLNVSVGSSHNLHTYLGFGVRW